MGRRLLFLILFLSCLLATSNFFSEKFGLYDSTWWIDMINHAIGGMVVAGAFIYLSLQRRKKIDTTMFIFVLAVGVLWEFYEIYTGFMNVSDPGYYMDTANDLCFDMLGAGIMYLLNKKKIYEN